MWSVSLSHSSGEEGERTGKMCDFIASKLSPQQLAKAQAHCPQLGAGQVR
jgi:hypothetical protein